MAMEMVAKQGQNWLYIIVIDMNLVCDQLS